MRTSVSKYIFLIVGFLFLSFFLFSCSKSKLTHHKEWGKFFHENNIEGCVMWNNYYQGTFGVYGFGEIQKRVLPAETFNLVLAMAGLETGVVRDTSMVIPDSLGLQQLSGISMGEAFRTNNEAYFQWISQQIGKVKMKFWIDSTYYGNKEMGANMSTFWKDGTLKISPDEQLGLMQRMYRGKLAFQSRTKELTKKLMIKKIAHRDTLYYQQGVGSEKDGNVGWLVGWLQKKDEAFIFSIKALDTDKKSDLNAKTLNVLYKIFQDKGFVDESGRLK